MSCIRGLDRLHQLCVSCHCNGFSPSPPMSSISAADRSSMHVQRLSPIATFCVCACCVSSHHHRRQLLFISSSLISPPFSVLAQARSSQNGSSQEQPEPTRSTQKHPEAPRSTQKHPGADRSTQKHENKTHPQKTAPSVFSGCVRFLCRNAGVVLRSPKSTSERLKRCS